MNPIAILKLLKAAKDIRDYVKKPNNLDLQSEMFLERLDKAEKKNSELEKRLAKVEFVKNNKETKDEGMYSSLKKEIQKIKNASKK